MKISTMAQPALPQPLSDRSPNMSNRQRNQMKIAEIQMKNLKLHRRTSPKSFVMLSIVQPFRRPGRVAQHEQPASSAGLCGPPIQVTTRGNEGQLLAGSSGKVE